MARAESKMVMGYLPIEERHYPALLSLITPATPSIKMLDPFAGQGEFLEAAASAWNITPYANELDGERAANCMERFGPKQAVRCDVERLIASNNAFGLIWANPPYDHDAAAQDNKRVEFRYLRHAWKWAQDGGIVIWVVYRHHITEDAAAFLAKNSRSVDVWALPGKHLGEYDQVTLVAIKGINPDPEALYTQILAEKAQPRLLAVQPEPVYRLPQPPSLTRFVFAPDMIDEEQGLRLIEEQGAWKTQGFQALLEIPRPPVQIEPVVAPRPGHTALVLAAGVANGAVIETADYGQVAIRGKTQHIEQVARVEVEAAPNDPDRQVKKTTIRLKPTTTLTLLAHDGTVVEMDGDEALLNFITSNRKALAQYLNQKFSPMYRFDFNGMSRFLDRIRLKGKYPLYTAQKHVVAAVTRGFESRESILLIGQMGCGKTALGGTTAISIATGVVNALRNQITGDQVVLVVAPPHLIDKWKRELLSISPNIVVEQLNRHEDVKAFMSRAVRLGSGIAKIGLIKRDMTKLGAGREAAVIWRTENVALWRKDQPTPEGYEPQQRIAKQRVPKCPYCGCTVMQEKKDIETPATESWLKSGKRYCQICNTPLWQDARDKGSRPKPGQKYPTKNPRYRLDEYIKRLYGDRVFLLIWDECHEAQNGDTGNGESFGRLAGVAQKVLAMTGTPFNGRSSSIFNLEYHLNPRTRQRYNWGGAARFSRKARGELSFPIVVEDNSKQRGRAESRWVSEMGVREQVVEERPSYDKETGAFTGTTTYERPYEEAPGISPLLVAEVLDHAVFFSLKDLGKVLPRYEEIALPVDMEADTYEQYDRTRQMLKDYLIQRKWEGDTTFRGAYLQWAMGWVNTPFRPYQVIHNLKHGLTGEKQPYIVTSIPSYGEERVYPKEQAIIDLIKAELSENRPCVIYLRQTDTRDIQPRIEALIRRYVPEARPFILKNTVDAERREKVIDAEISRGTNVLICNPTLVQTGLDLIYFPTLIFYEITFNLSTMMQAAARSYRLNQNHTLCKVYYLFYEATMEQTAVQLMSRKQRAAKLLTGDIGLTGLDALTEGEGGLEEALLAAIGRDEALLDPSELFKADSAQGVIDAEDAAFWNVEVDEATPTTVVEFTPGLPLGDDPLIAVAIELGGVLHQVEADSTHQLIRADDPHFLMQSVGSYLDNVHIMADSNQYARLQAELLIALTEGIQNEDGTCCVLGMNDLGFKHDPLNESSLRHWLQSWLKEQRLVFTGCEDEVAVKIIHLAKQTLDLLQPENRTATDETMPEYNPAALLPQTAVRKPVSKRVKRKFNLLALPDELAETSSSRPLTAPEELAVQQLALF